MLLGGYALLIDEAGEIIGEPEWDVLDRGVVNYRFFPFNRLWSGTTLVRRRYLEENSWRFEQRFFPADDYHMWLKFSLKYKIYLIPEVLYYYRIHGKNLSLTETGSIADETIDTHNMALEDVLGIDLKVDLRRFWYQRLSSVEEWEKLLATCQRLSDLYASLDFLSLADKLKTRFYYDALIYGFWNANKDDLLKDVKLKDILPYMRLGHLYLAYKGVKKLWQRFR